MSDLRMNEELRKALEELADGWRRRFTAGNTGEWVREELLAVLSNCSRIEESHEPEATTKALLDRWDGVLRKLGPE